MDRTNAPRRTGFRYSLRALLVVVTVLSIWLGWNANYVLERQRLLRSKDFLRTLEPYGRDPRDIQHAARLARQGIVLAGASSMLPAPYQHRPFGRSIPLAWRMLGAEPLEMDIWLTDDHYSIDDAKRIGRLFPECPITLIPAELAKQEFLR
jgi:hypothetical protein